MGKPLEFRDFPLSLAALAPFGPYKAFVTDIVDGDTYGMLVSLGFDEYRYTRIRLWGLDTAETFQPSSRAEKTRGLAASARVAELVLGEPVILYTQRDRQTLGRFIANVMYLGADGITPLSLADTLRAEGYAKVTP